MDHLYSTCFADLLARGGALADVRAAYEADYLAHIADTTRLYPGMAEALAELAQLGKLACVTNKPERLSAALLAALAVAQHFAAIIGGDTCAESKPSPIVLAEASRRVGRTRARGDDRRLAPGCPLRQVLRGSDDLVRVGLRAAAPATSSPT